MGILTIVAEIIVLVSLAVSIKSSYKSYTRTQAPKQVKRFRLVLSVASIALWAYFFAFLLISGGYNALIHVMTLDPSAQALLAAFPIGFIITKLVIDFLIMCQRVYRIYCLRESGWFKAQQLFGAVVPYLFEFSIAIAVIVMLANPAFFVLGQIYIKVFFFDLLFQTYANCYKDKHCYKKSVNWDYFLASNYVMITGVILTFLVLIGVVQFASPLMNAIIFLKTAAYLIAHSIYDAKYNTNKPAWWRVALQGVFAGGQIVLGALILAGAFALPYGVLGLLISMLTVKMIVIFALKEYVNYESQYDSDKVLASEKTAAVIAENRPTPLPLSLYYNVGQKCFEKIRKEKNNESKQAVLSKSEAQKTFFNSVSSSMN